MIYPVLSVKQPWASLIISGCKNIENRVWPPPDKLIGQRLLIHASKTIDREALRLDIVKSHLRFIRENPMPLGCILGSVIVIDCLKPFDDKSENEWWAEDQCGWILSYPRKLKNPIKAVGALKIWEFNLPRGVEI